MLNESLKDKWLHHVRIQDIQSKKNSMAMWQGPYLSPMWMEGRGGMGPAQGRKVGRNRREGTFCYQEPLSEIASVVTLLYICKKKLRNSIPHSPRRGRKMKDLLCHTIILYCGLKANWIMRRHKICLQIS